MELADDGIDVAVARRVLKVSRSGYYEWRDRPLSERDVGNAYLANTDVDIHTPARGSYGAPRMYAELRLGQGLTVSRKRVAGLLRLTVAGLGSAATPTGNDAGSRCRSPTMTGCSAGSSPTPRIGSGALTSRSIRLRPASSTAARWWTCSAASSWVRRSPTTGARSLSWTTSRWPTGGDGPRPAPWFTATRGSVYTSSVFGHRLPEAGLLGPMGRLAS